MCCCCCCPQHAAADPERRRLAACRAFPGLLSLFGQPTLLQCSTVHTVMQPSWDTAFMKGWERRKHQRSGVGRDVWWPAWSTGQRDHACSGAAVRLLLCIQAAVYSGALANREAGHSGARCCTLQSANQRQQQDESALHSAARPVDHTAERSGSAPSDSCLRHAASVSRHIHFCRDLWLSLTVTEACIDRRGNATSSSSSCRLGS